MIAVQTQYKWTPQRTQRAVDKGAYRNFAHAAASIRKDARKSIKARKKPSRPGEPVHTHRGTFARRAILYAADKQGAVVGFAASKIDQAMEVHEHGGERGGVRFPKRPVMFPALQRNLARFHRDWKGVIN